MRDFFEQSLFIDKAYRDEVNKQLNEYFGIIGSVFRSKGIKANIYLTGSLARKEPTVFIEEGYNPRLNSDIDFVVGVECDFEHNEWLINITDYLNREFPSFVSSVVLIQNSKLNRVRSNIGRDLLLTIENPILRELDIPKKFDNKVGAQDCLDNIVNQLACYYLHPNMTNENSNSILYKDISKHYLKLIFECLSSLFLDSPNGLTSRISEIYHRRNEKCISNVIDEETLKDLFYAREMRGKYNIPQYDIDKLVLYALEKVVCKIGKSDDIFMALTKKAQTDRNVVSAFQCTMTAWLMRRGCENNSDICEWSELMANTIEGIDANVQVFEGQELLKNTEWRKLIFDNSSEHELIEALRAFRRLYIRHQYFNNTGVSVIPDLLQHS